MNPNTALQTSDPKSNIVLIKQIRILRFTESTIESNPTQDLILYSIFKLFTPLQYTQQPTVLCVSRQAKEEPWRQDWQNKRP